MAMMDDDYMITLWAVGQGTKYPVMEFSKILVKVLIF